MPRATVSVIASLTLLTTFGIFVFGSAIGPRQTEPLVELPWVQPTAQSFMVLTAFAIAFLCYGRHRALGGAWAFWAGMVFLANGVLGVFYVLAWPGLLGDRGVIAQSPNTASWFFMLLYCCLATLMLAVSARQPVRLRPSHFLAGYALTAVTAALVGSLSDLSEDLLPTLVVNGVFTPLTILWTAVLIVLAAVGSVIAQRRCLLDRDPVLGYMALFLVLIAFGLLITTLGGKRYDVWWYAGRFVLVGSYVSALSGFLQEGYSLFGREKERAKERQQLLQTVQAQSEELQSQNEELQSQYEELQTRSKEFERLLAELNATFASLADPVLVFDASGRTVRANPSTLAIYGIDPVTAGIERFVQHAAIRRSEGVPLSWEELPGIRALREKRRVSDQFLTTDAQGLERVIQVTASPLVQGGSVVGAVGVWHDVTEQERLLISERDAREQAERAVRIRNDFLSVAAHELKTPVTSLKGFAQVIVRKYTRTGIMDHGQVIHAMKRIDQQTTRLTRLTEELLDVSRLEAGKLVIAPHQTDISSLLDHAVASLREIHPSRAFHVRNDGPVWALVDQSRLEQVITNLVDNAVKFSPAESPVEITLALEQAGQVAISVRDHGMGIPAGERVRVFDRFYQAHPEYHHAGMGLGLYISSQIVQMHGGAISCEDTGGEGALFVVRLPVAGGDEKG